MGRHRFVDLTDDKAGVVTSVVKANHKFTMSGHPVEIDAGTAEHDRSHADIKEKSSLARMALT
jgi:hypothetical protein